MIAPNESRRSKMQMSRLTLLLLTTLPIFILIFKHTENYHQVIKVYFAIVSQKELEDLQRWKEANRAPPVHLNPERLGKPIHTMSTVTFTLSSTNFCNTNLIWECLYTLPHWNGVICFLMYQGGSVSLDEARQKQFKDLRCSKLQKKVLYPVNIYAPLNIFWTRCEVFTWHTF